MLAGGAVAGFVNGFFGGGGGMIVIPLLTALLKTEKKKAHATTIAIILPLSLISGAVYLFKGAAKLDILAAAGGGVIAGGIIGAILLNKISNEKIAVIFYIVMIVSGISLVLFR